MAKKPDWRNGFEQPYIKPKGKVNMGWFVLMIIALLVLAYFKVMGY